MDGVTTVIIAAAVMGVCFLLISAFSYMYSLGGLKNKRDEAVDDSSQRGWLL